MLQEGKGPINFTVFLTLFGEKLNGKPGAGLATLGRAASLNPTWAPPGLCPPRRCGAHSFIPNPKALIIASPNSVLGNVFSASLPKSQIPTSLSGLPTSRQQSWLEPRGKLRVGEHLPASSGMWSDPPAPWVPPGGAMEAGVWVLTFSLGLPGTDPEEAILSAFRMFDPSGKGVVAKDE